MKGNGWKYQAILAKVAEATASLRPLHPVSVNVKVLGVVPYSTLVRDRRDESRSLCFQGKETLWLLLCPSLPSFLLAVQAFACLIIIQYIFER